MRQVPMLDQSSFCDCLLPTQDDSPVTPSKLVVTPQNDADRSGRRS